MKVIIIDDDKASIDVLVNQLKTFEDTNIVGTASTAIKGINLVKQEQPDLLFLDVEMPDMTGLDLLDKLNSIQQKPCRVVIYTGHEKYVLPAFRGKAFDFLLKPASMDELKKIIHRYYVEGDAQDSQNTKDPDKLLLYVNALDFRVVSISNVGLFQYNHDLRVWEVFVAGRKDPVRLKRSTNNETLLAMDKRFVQVSQRHIININYLIEVDEGVCRLYPPFDLINNIKVGRVFRKQLTDRFCTL